MWMMPGMSIAGLPRLGLSRLGVYYDGFDDDDAGVEGFYDVYVVDIAGPADDIGRFNITRSRCRW